MGGKVERGAGGWRRLTGLVATDQIAEIGIDETGRIFVSPQKLVLSRVHRMSRGVLWDPNDRRLYTPACPDRSRTAWLRALLRCAQDHGVVLESAASTRWTNVPDDLRHDFEVELSRPSPPT